MLDVLGGQHFCNTAVVMVRCNKSHMNMVQPQERCKDVRAKKLLLLFITIWCWGGKECEKAFVLGIEVG